MQILVRISLELYNFSSTWHDSGYTKLQKEQVNVLNALPDHARLVQECLIRHECV